LLIYYFISYFKGIIMQPTTCNQWQGTIKAINHGTIVSEVILEIAPEVSMTAIVAKSSVETMGLKVGSTFYALIKSAEAGC
jgi:molybdopterin-binding protein